MSAFIDITGQRFGRWTVLRRAEKLGPVYGWLCRCDCGKQSVVRGCPLRSGKTKSCGCLSMDVSSTTNRIHGWKGTRTYKAWSSMRERCRLKSRRDWNRYGGRGITCCKRWDKFENFLADMGPRPERMSLERNDNNGNYEPGNCRWATAEEQANNRSTSLRLTAFGETKTATQWARDPRCAVSYDTLLNRLASGWPADLAITKRLRGEQVSA
jgi:hypothetical protein